MEIKTEKRELRLQCLALRKQKSSVELKTLSETICNNLLDYYQFSGKTVFCYLSSNSGLEVDTGLLIRTLQTRADVRICVPLVVSAGGEMIAAELGDETELTSNKWGIPEPRFGKEIPVSEIDVSVVPMLSGDRMGNRLGFGKGFYDRFLSAFNGKKIGLCFHFCIFDRIPSLKHDLLMHTIISEKEIIKLN